MNDSLHTRHGSRHIARLLHRADQNFHAMRQIAGRRFEIKSPDGHARNVLPQRFHEASPYKARSASNKNHGFLSQSRIECNESFNCEAHIGPRRSDCMEESSCGAGIEAIRETRRRRSHQSLDHSNNFKRCQERASYVNCMLGSSGRPANNLKNRLHPIGTSRTPD